MVGTTKQVLLTTVVVMAFMVMTGFSIAPDVHGEDAEIIDPKSNNSLIGVSGEGEVKVEPEVAYVTLGVETSSPDPQKAQAENSDIMEDVVETLRDQGIAEEDIRIGHYSIGQQYVRPDEEEEPDYQVANHIDITVHDLDNVGSVLEASVNQGVNNIRSLEFGVLDEEEYKMKALDNALENAEQKADRIASFYDKSLDDIKQVLESDTSLGRMQMDMDMEYTVSEEALEMSDDVYGTAGLDAQPGEVTFEADVDVIYEMQ
ncbi:SIMPL domain-containing protein [Natranaerobius thermophilus]|uniref:SIMPL domain-containing protein n=1 Tax=Natranaerobius thermophilus TaxID=375929 RepID=UPI002F40A396